MPFLDFEKDAYDQIRECIAHLSYRGQLDKAAQLAGQQLELLKPAVFAMGTPGYIGPVAQVQRGTVLVLLADSDSERVCTVYFKPTAKMAACVEELQQQLDRDDLPEALLKTRGDPTNTMAMGRWVAEEYGGAPGATTPDMPPEFLMVLLGLLFRGCGEGLHKLIELLDVLISDDICPAMVFLSGPASSGIAGKFCGVWPVTIGLAPYFDTVVPE